MVHINDRSVVKHPKSRSELINFDDETGLWWTENWQLWTVYLNSIPHWFPHFLLIFKDNRWHHAFTVMKNPESASGPHVRCVWNRQLSTMLVKRISHPSETLNAWWYFWEPTPLTQGQESIMALNSLHKNKDLNVRCVFLLIKTVSVTCLSLPRPLFIVLSKQSIIWVVAERCYIHTWHTESSSARSRSLGTAQGFVPLPIVAEFTHSSPDSGRQFFVSTITFR